MKAIAVVAKDLAIGKNGKLLFRLPTDLTHFKNETLGKTLILGRKTMDTIPGKKPLPGRNTIVLSRRTGTRFGFFEDKHFCYSLGSKEAVMNYVNQHFADEDVYVAGGQQIYEMFLDDCTELVLTEVDAVVPDADAFFPDFRSTGEFELYSEEGPVKDGYYTYHIRRYRRIDG